MTENIVTGKKYRILTDAASDAWDRISLWTKASDVHYNDGSTAEMNRPINILKRSSAYTVGMIAYEPTAPSWTMLRCTTAGTTASTVPSTYQTISSAGTTITDGTAKFVVYDVRPTTTLSSSQYLVPSVSLVNSFNSELTANGNKFYFDYKNGQYGWNTSASRGSSTFHAFKVQTDTKHNVYVSLSIYANDDTHHIDGRARLYVDGVEKTNAYIDWGWPSGGGGTKNASSSTISV